MGHSGDRLDWCCGGNDFTYEGQRRYIFGQYSSQYHSEANIEQSLLVPFLDERARRHLLNPKHQRSTVLVSLAARDQTLAVGGPRHAQRPTPTGPSTFKGMHRMQHMSRHAVSTLFQLMLKLCHPRMSSEPLIIPSIQAFRGCSTCHVKLFQSKLNCVAGRRHRQNPRNHPINARPAEIFAEAGRVCFLLRLCA